VAAFRHNERLFATLCLQANQITAIATLPTNPSKPFNFTIKTMGSKQSKHRPRTRCPSWAASHWLFCLSMQFIANLYYGSVTQLITPFILLFNSRVIDRIAIKIEKPEIIN